MTETNNFANNLKYLRQSRDMEQLELAQLLGRKSASSISEWEKGRYTPKAGILNDLSKIFDVPLSALMNEDLQNHNHIHENKDVPVLTLDEILDSVENYSGGQLSESDREMLRIIIETKKASMESETKN